MTSDDKVGGLKKVKIMMTQYLNGPLSVSIRCLIALRVLSNWTRYRRLYLPRPTLHATTFLSASLKGWLDFRNFFSLAQIFHLHS